MKKNNWRESERKRESERGRKVSGTVLCGVVCGVVLLQLILQYLIFGERTNFFFFTHNVLKLARTDTTHKTIIEQTR
jgi:hypothetical protein